MNLSFFYKISFGGTSLAGLQKAHSRRNFHGCLENVLYNDISVIDRAKEKQVVIAVSRNHVLIQLCLRAALFGLLVIVSCWLPNFSIMRALYFCDPYHVLLNYTRDFSFFHNHCLGNLGVKPITNPLIHCHNDRDSGIRNSQEGKCIIYEADVMAAVLYSHKCNLYKKMAWSWLYYSILCVHRGMSPLHAPNPLMCQWRLPVLEVSSVCRGSPVEKACRSVCSSERGTKRACWWPLTCSTTQERCGFIWARREHDYRSIRPDGSWRTSQQVELRYKNVYSFSLFDGNSETHLSCFSKSTSMPPVSLRMAACGITNIKQMQNV